MVAQKLLYSYSDCILNRFISRIRDILHKYFLVNMKSQEGKNIVKYRWWIISFFILLTIVLGLQIPKAEFDPDLDNYLPAKMPARINTYKIEKIFGGNSMLMVVLETDDVLKTETLQRLEKLSNAFSSLEVVKKNLSLFTSKNIASEDGMMIVGDAIEGIPNTPEEREELREKLRKNKMVYEITVSTDFKMSSIIIILNKGADDEEVLESVNAVLEEFPGPEKAYIGGLPLIREMATSEMTHDFLLLMPVGLVVMLIMLYAFFRQKRGVFLPFSVVVMSIFISMGVLPILGWKLSMISILLPVMLIAIANDYGIHIVSHYQELQKEEGEKAIPFRIALRVYQYLKRPVILTGLTTIVGTMSLLTHKMIPARQLGVLSTIGITVALIMSLFFIPAVLSLFKKTQPSKTFFGIKKDYLGVVLSFIGRKVSMHPKTILTSSVLLSLVVGIGIYFLEVDTDLVRFFPKNHPIRQGAEVIDEHFGGTQTLSVLIEGDIKDPDLLKRLEYYEMELKDFPGVGRVASVSDVIREISKALNDKGDSLYDKIPDTRNAVAQYFGLYNMSGDEGDFDQLVDFDYRYARMIITLDDASNQSIKKIIEKIEQITANDPYDISIGGRSYTTLELSNLVVNGQVRSIGIAILAIFLLISLIFKSVSSGLISIVPLGLAVIFLFGLMGILGIRLDISTAILSSIMIGVGVDYTIHFIWRYKFERKSIAEPGKAVQRTIETTGRGIFFNATSVIIGFLVLFLSSFPPIRFFGFLVIISISACLAGAFLVIPGILMLSKPRFVEPVEDKD